MGSGAAVQTLRPEPSHSLLTTPFADKTQSSQPVKGFPLEFNEVTKYGQGLKVEWFTVLLAMIFFWLTLVNPDARGRGAYTTHWLGRGVGTNPALRSAIRL